MLHTVSRRLVDLRTDHKGQDLVEYALLSGLMACCALAIFPAITATGNYFSQVMAVLSTVISQTAGATQ